MLKRKISVIGLGYVGLPLAVAFASKASVIAFDINQTRIDQLKAGIDYTLEVESGDLQAATLCITSNPDDLDKADFHIITVPTPVNEVNQPDLTLLLEASRTVAMALKPGDIVVYESTVYPGATEEECIPILEQYSNLKCSKDFFVGYSPERVNPGDKNHTLTKIKKVVSAQDKVILPIIVSVYAAIVEAGIYEVSSIKVAEAAKVIENTQRDINIAFINELKMIFDKMDIDIYEVLKAAETKWNFLPFKPGLVGGHCIGVDPYYLTHKAEQIGYHPAMILSGRKINDGMGKYIAENAVKKMISKNIHVYGAKVGLLGFTFKENCPDVRNTKVVDVIRELNDYHICTVVCDPIADQQQAKASYGIELVDIKALAECDVIISLVAHECFLQPLFIYTISNARLFIDFKNQFNNYVKNHIDEKEVVNS